MASCCQLARLQRITLLCDSALRPFVGSTADRRVLNEEALATALRVALAPHGLRVVLEDLGRLGSRAQLELIREAIALIGVHGAGLMWNFFLPAGSLLVELLNERNANEYYSNQCRWTRRPYASWQNNQTEREVSALDASGKVCSGMSFVRVCNCCFRNEIDTTLDRDDTVTR